MCHAVEQLAQQVAVPPDGHVHGARPAADPFPLGVPQARRAAPQLGARMPRVDVGGHAAAHVLADAAREIDFARARIEQRRPRPVGTAAFVLVNAPDFQAGPRRIEVGSRAARRRGPGAWSRARGRCRRSRRRRRRFRPAVAIDIGHRQIVISLAAIVAVARRAVVAVEDPALGELAVAPVPGGQHGPRVVAAAHHQARPLAVQIGDAGQEAIDAVAVVVAPSRAPRRAAAGNRPWPAPRRCGRRTR